MEGSSLLVSQLINATIGSDFDKRALFDLQRVCSSALSQTGAHEKDIIHKIEKSLATKKGAKHAAEFARKYNQLLQLNTIKNPAHVVEFLQQVSVSNERTDLFNAGVKVASTPYHMAYTPSHAQIPYLTGISGRLSQQPSSHSISTTNQSSGIASRSISSTLAGMTSRTRNDASSTTVTQHTRPTPAVYKYKELFKEYVEEEQLIQDVLLVAQGIEGKLARYHPPSEQYKLPDNIRVKTHHRSMCNRLFEAGWLYNRIKQYQDSKTTDTMFGPIGQSFCVALYLELTNFHRLLAVLDAQLKTQVAEGTKKFTLDRLVTWFHEPIKNLRLLACLADISKGKKGGVLLTEIYSYTNQGDASRRNLISHVLALTAKPLYEVITRWMYAGELDDSYSEFFISADPQVSAENVWHAKYSLRKSMIPSFISQELAQKILLVGKSVVFLHKVCKDSTMVLDMESIRNARVYDSNCMFDPDRHEEFVTMVNTTYREISKHLMNILHTRYFFVSHLKAMRRYLLLGQGDFIHHLMELLVEELNKDASTLYMHSLHNVLETAASRSLSNLYEDKDIMERLDVRLLETSEGDLGWDVFSLDYRTSGPISTIFTHDIMIFYLRIFNFLWRAKRMEFVLADMWNQKQHYSRLLRDMNECSELMHVAHHIAAEMLYFIRQFSYYINFEVIECLWTELLDQVHKAEGLDYIIAAHQMFIDNMIKRCLIGEENRALFSQLRMIFDQIIKFQSILVNFFEAAAQEKLLRDEYQKRRKPSRRSPKTETEPSEAEEMEEQARRGEFVRQKVKPTRNQLKIVNTTYQGKVTNFLVMLATQTDYTIQGLLMRLDFNEHYKQKEPILSSPQAIKKMTPPRRQPQLLGVAQPVGGLVGILGGRISGQ